MGIIFEQTLILLIFVATGIVLGKTKIVDFTHSKILSQVLVYVILPCNVISSFSRNFTPQYLDSNYKIIVASILILLVVLFVMHFVAKLFSKNSYERCVYEYSLSIPSYGYMGYILSEALLGSVGHTNFLFFSIPATIYIYSVAFSKLTKRGFSLKKLIHPGIISIIIGIALGLLQIPIPAMVSSVMTTASSCLAPLSMLLTGIVISEFDIKSIVSNKKIYFLSALRLIVIPLIIGGIVSLFGNATLTAVTVLFYAMPCGLNTVVFPKLVDENCKIGAGIALVSSVISLATLPFILNLFGIGG